MLRTKIRVIYIINESFVVFLEAFLIESWRNAQIRLKILGFVVGQNEPRAARVRIHVRIPGILLRASFGYRICDIVRLRSVDILKSGLIFFELAHLLFFRAHGILRVDRARRECASFFIIQVRRGRRRRGRVGR